MFSSLHHKTVAVVGVLQDDADPMVSVMKLDKSLQNHMPTLGVGITNSRNQRISRIAIDTS